MDPRRQVLSVTLLVFCALAPLHHSAADESQGEDGTEHSVALHSEAVLQEQAVPPGLQQALRDAEAEDWRELEEHGLPLSQPGVFTSARTSGDPLRMQTEIAAMAFYYKTLSEVLHDGQRRGSSFRGDLVEQIRRESLFQECIESYLVCDMLWSQNEKLARQGIDLFLRNGLRPGIGLPWQATGSSRIETIWDAIREFTFGYRFEGVDEFRAWWAAHRDEARDDWARQAVDGILAVGDMPDEDNRHIIYMITRHVAAASEETFPAFRSWWKLNRSRPREEAAAALVESSIDDLTAETSAERTGAMRQILSFACMRDVAISHLPANGPARVPDRELMAEVQNAYQAWWQENGGGFVVGPYDDTCDGLWFVMTSSEPAPETP